MTSAAERSRPELDVSVLVTSPPGSPRLDEALASVARQTLRPRDVVVVEEGSAARSDAVRRAPSAWVAFCRAGDVWAPHKLARHATAAWYCPDASFTFSDWYAVDERGPSRTTCADPAYRAVRRVAVAPNIVRLDRRALGAALYESDLLVVSTLVVKRAVLARVLGSYAAGDAGDDFDAVLRLAASAGAAAAIEEPLVGHRPGRDVRAGDPAVRGALWKRIAASPELYPPGVAAFVRSDRRRCIAAAGRRGLESGRFAEAHRYLRESLALAPNPQTLTLYAVASALDTPLGRYLGARLSRRTRAVLD